MKRKLILALFLVVGVASISRADEFSSIMSQMTKELKLTDDQVNGIKPIIKESIEKRQAYLQSLKSEIVVNKKQVRATMRALRNDENEKLSKILTQAQMDKLIQKQRVREQFNSDQIDFNQNGIDGFVATPEGGAFQF